PCGRGSPDLGFANRFPRTGVTAHQDPCSRTALDLGDKKRMLAFTVTNHRLVCVKRPMPKLRPRWALVRVRLVGICNTDVELLHGYYGFQGIPGHEFVGEVVEVKGVSASGRKKWIGKRVCGEINISCGALGRRPICDFCKRGMKTHCAQRTVLG